jgi:Flp pilus assembly protein TadG
VELALLLPVLLLLCVGTADLARLFHARVTIMNAARAGAIEAARHPTSFQDGALCHEDTNRVMCAVQAEVGGSPIVVVPDDVSLICTPDPCAEALGNTVTVTVDGRFDLITPLLSSVLGGTTINMTETAEAQIAVEPIVVATSPSPGASIAPSPIPSVAPSPSPGASSSPGPSPSPGVSPSPGASTAPSPSPSPYCLPPTADFFVSPSSGKKKKTNFVFTDLSTTTPECPITWSWNFGDGAGESPLQNPTHEYQTSGVFTVTLVVSNYGGSDSESRNITVTN